jgi:hypothetical protein
MLLSVRVRAGELGAVGPHEGRSLSNEIIISPETANVRVRSGRLNFLFPNTTSNEIDSLYRENVQKARAYFGLRWSESAPPQLSDQEFEFFTREVTLHWLYFYVINRLPPVIRRTDWDHPQSRRIVTSNVFERFGPDSEESIMAGAQLIGISAHAYRDWLEGDGRFAEMF